MALYYNANTLDVDSISTHSDSTKGQQQKKEEGNCLGNNADNGCKSMAVVESGPYTGIHIGTHPWTDTNIQCLRHQG